MHSYVCQDIVKEFRKYDVEPDKYFVKYEGENTVTGKVCRIRTTQPW
jgi:actin-related protein 3